MTAAGRARICVSVAPRSAESVRESLRAGADGDLVEIRLDGLPATALAGDNLRSWIAGAPVPVIATCRPRSQGGGYDAPEADRRAVLEAALAAGARWIDVELESTLARDLVERHRDRVLLSHHWSAPCPDDLGARLEAVLRLRPAVGKLVAPAETPADAAGLLRAGRSLAAAGIVPACFAMGEAGRASRLLAGLDGGLVYATPAASAMVTAPGQWPVARLRGDLAAARWSVAADRYGLVGDPVEHSLSPAVFNSAFAADDRKACYVPLPGRPFSELLSLADDAGFRGLSVTMPFKEEAARACVRLASLAERSGVVNTLARAQDGWEGHNTDGPAVVAALSAALDVDGARVAIVGAGGAARAAAFALRDAGARLVVLNRTVERAAELAEDVGTSAWGRPGELGDHDCDAVVNATPVGMNGTARTPVSTAGLRGGEVVMEMVYRPRETELLRAARERGCRTVPGLEMFLHQASAQHVIWFGQEPVAGVMRAAAERRLEGPDPGPGG